LITGFANGGAAWLVGAWVKQCRRLGLERVDDGGLVWETSTGSAWCDRERYWMLRSSFDFVKVTGSGMVVLEEFQR
jgi:hypothetical protein